MGKHPFKIIPTAHDTPKFTFESNNPTVATIDADGTITIHSAGETTITVKSDATDNYKAGVVTAKIKVTPKEITATITPNNKTYDGNTAGTIKDSIRYEGIINKDTVYMENTTLAFDNKNVGENKTVTAKDYSLAGDKKGNYKIGTITVNTAAITPKEVTVNVVVNNKSYDGLTDASYKVEPSLTGVVPLDKVTLINGTPTFKSANVQDDIAIEFTPFSIEGDDQGNYTLVQPTGIKANITKMNLSWAKDTHYTLSTRDWRTTGLHLLILSSRQKKDIR